MRARNDGQWATWRKLKVEMGSSTADALTRASTLLGDRNASGFFTELDLSSVSGMSSGLHVSFEHNTP